MPALMDCKQTRLNQTSSSMLQYYLLVSLVTAMMVEQTPREKVLNAQRRTKNNIGWNEGATLSSSVMPNSWSTKMKSFK